MWKRILEDLELIKKKETVIQTGHNIWKCEVTKDKVKILR